MFCILIAAIDAAITGVRIEEPFAKTRRKKGQIGKEGQICSV